jgi:peptide/nickel transport system substrate-binding protein
VKNQAFKISGFLVSGFLLASLLMACGATATPAVAPTTAPPTAVSTPAAIAPTGVAKSAQGELRIGTGLNIPATMDVTKGSNGYNMITYGAGETLMRFNTQQKLEPWLAESVTSLDPTTWQVKLRKGVKFHDGSVMTAKEVADSFKRMWENLPGATNFISKETQVTIGDDYTLIFKTPKPAGDFPYNTASWNFVINKPGTTASVLTGAYKPIKLDKDQEFVLEAFPDYWGGSPAIKTIRIKVVVDGNARILALQSGDLDMLTNVPPELAKSLGDDFEKTVVPGTRIHHVILNHAKAPFNAKAVREAAAFGIDRETLNKATLDNQGGILTNILPNHVGAEVVAAQKTEIAKAKQLLEDAGWKAGADNIREKEGKKLTFTLYSYPGRPELTQMAVAIQSQLKSIGFEVKVQEVRDITAQIKDGDFEAAMFSVGLAGDPQYIYGVTLIKGAIYNYGSYANPQLDALYAQLQVEADLTKRQTLSKQIQEIVKADSPNLYLVAPPLITAFKKGAIKGYTPHPNDLYLLDRTISL